MKKKSFIIIVGVLLIIAICIGAGVLISRQSTKIDTTATKLPVTAKTTTELTTKEIDWDWGDKPEVNENSLKDDEFNITMEKENTIQFLCIGNSDLYSGYIPNITWRDYGIPSASIAYANLTQPQAYTHLRLAFEVQRPRVVMIECSTLYEGLGYVASATADTSREITEPEINTNLSKLELRKLNHGYKMSTKNVPILQEKYAFKNKKFDDPSEENARYLNKMIKFCKDCGATPFLVYFPTVVYWNYARHNSLQKIADDNGIEFVDLNLLLDEMNFDMTTSFRDEGNHLNIHGATACTNYLAKHVKNQYQLDDCRRLNEYQDWNTACNEFEKIIANL